MDSQASWLDDGVVGSSRLFGRLLGELVRPAVLRSTMQRHEPNAGTQDTFLLDAGQAEQFTEIDFVSLASADVQCCKDIALLPPQCYGPERRPHAKRGSAVLANFEDVELSSAGVTNGGGLCNSPGSGGPRIPSRSFDREFRSLGSVGSR